MNELQDVISNVTAVVDRRVNDIIDPKISEEHVPNGWNFLRRAEVSYVQKEQGLFTGISVRLPG